MKSRSLKALVENLSSLSEGSSQQLVVALDGRSGVGKSTVARHLASRLGAQVVSGDDFYSGGTFEDWAQRTAEQKADLCIDWQRLRKEVLEPLVAGRSASYRPFNWTTWTGLSIEKLSCAPGGLVVLDGVYSCRPELADRIDVAILVRLPNATRRRRLLLRESEGYLSKWHAVWNEAEDFYFHNVCTEDTVDAIIERR